MKNNMLLMIATTGLVAGTVASAGGFPSLRKTASPTTVVSDISQRDSLDADYQAYKRNAEARIHRNEKRIAELKAKVEADKSQMKAEYHQKLAALEARNNKARTRLAEYKLQTKEHWNSFKREFSHDMDDLGHSLKDFTTNNVH